MIGEFLRGIGAFIRGARLTIGVERLRRLARAPFLINVAVIAIGFPFSIWLAIGWSEQIIPETSPDTAPLRILLQILLVLAIAAVALVALVLLAAVIAAPYLTRLSEAVEEHILGNPPDHEPTTVTGVLIDIGRSLGTMLGRLLIFLLIYPFIFALQFLPVVGTMLHVIAVALYGALVLSLDLSDPVFERHLDGFAERLRYLSNRKARYLGFGLAALGLMFLPLANLLVLPVGTAAATVLFLEQGNP